jgi:large subunit ribosomal protein L24
LKSKKPSKQRKKIALATEKEILKMMKVRLSKKLREKYRTRSVSVRKGDSVKILRGDFAGIEGKIIETDRHNQKVTVEGVTKEKVSGEQRRIPVHVSNVEMTTVDTGDRWRSDKFKKKTETSKPSTPDEVSTPEEVK